jgi:hypothetical protein
MDVGMIQILFTALLYPIVFLVVFRIGNPAPSLKSYFFSNLKKNFIENHFSFVYYTLFPFAVSHLLSYLIFAYLYL